MPSPRPLKTLRASQINRLYCVIALSLATLSTAALLIATLAFLGYGPSSAWRLLRDRPVMELVRYAELRMLGHPKLEAVALPVLGIVRGQLEREPPAELIDLGKGQQPKGLSRAAFDTAGKPIPAVAWAVAEAIVPATRLLTTVPGIADAMRQAQPGDILEIAPGSYRLDGALVTGHAGLPDRPITLRSNRPGAVRLLIATTQGIIVRQPHWIFENLDLQGACASDEDCEHAFHVVGAAAGSVIRNNRMSDFNAQVKVNGEGGRWPDNGLVQFNTLTNRGPRSASKPVAPIDLVGASGWKFVDNLVMGFAKAGGNGIAYGMFMKGGGSGGHIERNVVVCTPRAISQPGLRIGISVGGGGTGREFCRDRQCAAEFSDTVVANNVVAHCNDVGIDVNRSERTLVARNTLINTLGILVRDSPASAIVAGNLLDGHIRERGGGRVEQSGNQVHRRLDQVLLTPDALDLRWRELPEMAETAPSVATDLCGTPRPPASPPGATVAARCRPLMKP